jgi:hypothetical protein
MARVTTKTANTARKSWQERAETWRDKINISKIISRLEAFAAGCQAPEDCAVVPKEPTQEMLNAANITIDQYVAMLEKAPVSMPVTMSPAQVKAGSVLLDRVMPTLSASEITTKNESIKPEELLEMLRERYGEAFVEAIRGDYIPQEAKH